MQYSVDYAEKFEELYSAAWSGKHNTNLTILTDISSKLSGIWLDTFCGQGWHFSRSADHMQKVGIDSSKSQLDIARACNPKSTFFQADFSEFGLRKNCANLLTNFWGSYCYLDEKNQALVFFNQCCQAVRPSGALYWEILEIDSVADFNDSDFARKTKFQVKSITGNHWEFEDIGGLHEMYSPPLENFLAIANQYFSNVSILHDGHFMTHLVCESPFDKTNQTGETCREKFHTINTTH